MFTTGVLCTVCGAQVYLTSPLKPLNRIQWDLTESKSKISMSSTTFVLFGLIGKTRWPPRPLIGWDFFYFSTESAERPATKLDRKKDLKVLYQVCIFWADRKNKMATLANLSKRWHIILRLTICGPLGLLLLYFEDILKSTFSNEQILHWIMTYEWKLVIIILLLFYILYVTVYVLKQLLQVLKSVITV